jgi:hypothetical protein
MDFLGYFAPRGVYARNREFYNVRREKARQGSAPANIEVRLPVEIWGDSGVLF